MCLNMHFEVEKKQCSIGVYLLEVDNPKCSGDVYFPLYPAVDDGFAIIKMFNPDPLYLMYRPDCNKHNLITIITQINASH